MMVYWELLTGIVKRELVDPCLYRRTPALLAQETVIHYKSRWTRKIFKRPLD